MITIEQARDHPRYCTIPEAVLRGIYAYVERRVPPGGFLEYVLSNELFHAVANADLDSFTALQSLLLFIFNEVPMSCYGSRTKVKEWLAPGIEHEPATEH